VANTTNAAANKISVWEDDPEENVQVRVARPDPSKSPLAFSIAGEAPQPDNQLGSAGWRYWTAAVALRRCADFWAPQIPSGNWQVGQTLPVVLDQGADLNAYYDREALRFFHGPGPSGTVYSGESPDVTCHEMGHAILDTIKPQLWAVQAHEAAAFHESFGDMSAILSALQLPSLRAAILRDTHGHLYCSSRLSRLAEQLGTAIRVCRPDAVQPDCLRNAVNSFAYQDPITIPPLAPAAQVSSEPHSFSRIFTGAFFEALSGILTNRAANHQAPTDQELQTVSRDMADILVAGIRQAPVVANFYAQVAAGMIRAGSRKNLIYGRILAGVFVGRGILSFEAAATAEALQEAAAVALAAVAPIAAGPTAELAIVALPAAHYGLDQPLVIDAPSQPQQFFATAAGGDAAPIAPASSTTAAKAFVDDLFRSGRVDYNGIGRPEARLQHRPRLQTHELVQQDGAVRLRRRMFDCGFQHH